MKELKQFKEEVSLSRLENISKWASSASFLVMPDSSFLLSFFLIFLLLKIFHYRWSVFEALCFFFTVSLLFFEGGTQTAFFVPLQLFKILVAAAVTYFTSSSSSSFCSFFFSRLFLHLKLSWDFKIYNESIGGLLINLLCGEQTTQEKLTNDTSPFYKKQ